MGWISFAAIRRTTLVSMPPSLPPKRFERRFPVPAVKAGDLGLGPGEVVVVEAADVNLIGLWSGAGAVEGVERPQ